MWFMPDKSPKCLNQTYYDFELQFFAILLLYNYAEYKFNLCLLNKFKNTV